MGSVAMTQRILLVEDDKRLADLVCDYLRRNGFEVDHEADGLQVEPRLRSVPFDLLILDLMLPGRDGLSICKAAREFFHAPILMVTAKDSDIDQVLGLEFGADDYVIKPVDPRVLLARIQALLRRYQPRPEQDSSVLNFGRLTLENHGRRVSQAGQPVDLSSHEFDLLWLLASHAGEIQSRDSLFQTLHGRPYDGLDRTIDVRISHLRRKLGDSTETPFRIKTVWGRGYLFVPDAWD